MATLTRRLRKHAGRALTHPLVRDIVSDLAAAAIAALFARLQHTRTARRLEQRATAKVVRALGTSRSSSGRAGRKEQKGAL
jgi:hypothetical protein